MRYELLLQATPGEAFDLAAAFDALAARRPVSGPASGPGSPDTQKHWNLASQDIEIHLLREGARVVALELHVPLAESDTTIRDALREAAEAARGAGLTLYDPQLNRPVTVADEGAVADQFARNARYAGQVAGVSGLVGIGIQPETSGLPVSGRVILGIIGFVILMLFLSDTFARVLTATR